MTTSIETMAALEAALATAIENRDVVYAAQLESYPPNDDTAWNSLTIKQQMAVMSEKNQAEAAVKVARDALNEFNNTKAAFYTAREDARKAAETAFSETWQAIENAAEADSDWTRRPE
jgi:hypothetical protein